MTPNSLVSRPVILFLLLPLLLLGGYLITAFPYPPQPPVIHSSLSGLPHSSLSWSVYHEDYYQGGKYAALPLGRVCLLGRSVAHHSYTARQVRYWLIGPQDGPKVGILPRYQLHHLNRRMKVILVHGLSIPSIVWKDVAPVLASHGHHILLYGKFIRHGNSLSSYSDLSQDLYGRGYSDAPQVTYDVSLHTSQLALLMQHIKWDSAYIVGFSMASNEQPSP